MYLYLGRRRVSERKRRPLFLRPVPTGALIIATHYIHSMPFAIPRHEGHRSLTNLERR